MNTELKKQPSYRREIYQRAIWESFLKLDPRLEVRNPVMFVVEVGSVLTTVLWMQALLGQGEAPAGFIGAVAHLAMVHRAVCQFRRSRRRRTRQGSSRGPAQDPQANPGQETACSRKRDASV